MIFYSSNGRDKLTVRLPA